MDTQRWIMNRDDQNEQIFFSFFFQLEVSSRLPKPSLLGTNSYKGTSEINLDFIFLSPLVWKNSIINLSLIWSMLILY